MAMVHGQAPAQMELCSPRNPFAGDPPLWTLHSGDVPPPTRAQILLSRQILLERPRLEPRPNRSGPPDRDPAAKNHAYRFGLAFFLKTPPAFLDSTRGPALVKSIYGLVLFLAHNPLSFFKIGPAVQVSSFCELALRINVYLRFSPRF